MNKIRDLVATRPWFGWVLFAGTMLLVFLIGMLGASIFERRQESFQVQMVHPIAAWEPRNAVWGANFPRQYESYMATMRADFRSKYGGSAPIDYLAEYPHLVVLWAGYPFARAYEQGRGHAHAVDDSRRTFRTNTDMPGTCWACKSTDVPRLMRERGVAGFYASGWRELGPEVVNPIGCQDCHDPQTMSLRLSRPALVEALQRRGTDVDQLTHQQMRSLVCAQCHVEYYFAKEPKDYLVFPWDDGFAAEEMEAYFDRIGHVDWVHALSRAPMLKAQHPDYELYMTGTHAARGVSCADCHMPYRSEGGVKFTDHHIRSPLQNIANSCQVCHRESEQTLLRDVTSRQDKVKELRLIVEKSLAAAHIEAGAAWQAGASEAEMAAPLQLIRHAQWRWDWVAAANGVGFHSPNEALRVLGTSIQKAEQARAGIARVLWGRGVTEPVPLPDLPDKASAQHYIGLDPVQMEQVKQDLRERLFPQWDAAAAEREAAMPTPPAARHERYIQYGPPAGP
jgi:nitrite reductase (cytochrome c-552)